MAPQLPKSSGGTTMQKLLNGMISVLLGATTVAFVQVERLPAGTTVEIRTNEGIDLRDASGSGIHRRERPALLSMPALE
jgi:hypothetical protein